MPVIMRSLSNDGTLLGRRIAQDVAMDVLSATRFPTQLEIVHEDELSGGSKQLESMYSKANKDNLRTQYGSYLFLSHQETFSEAGFSQANLWKSAIPDIFADDEHGIYIRGHYVNAHTTLTMRLRTASLTALKSWIDNVRIIHGVRRLTWSHSLLCEYAIPQDFISFLSDAYHLKEATWPDNDTLKDYLKGNFREGVQTRANANDSYKEIITIEKQTNVTGVTEDEFFYNEVDKQPGIYETTITYSYTYRRPIAVSIVAPTMIRNKLIPKAYRDAWVPKIIDRSGDTPYYFLKSCYSPEETNLFFIGDGGSRVRQWDDWFPKTHHQNTQTVTIAPITVDLNDLRNVVNLYDLTTEFVPQEIFDYLKDNYTAHGLYKESLVVVEIFSVGAEEKKLPHYLDADLNLTTAVDMDPRRRHYLRISLFKDLPLMPDATMDLFLAQPEKAEALFKLYDEGVIVTSDYALAKPVIEADLTKHRPSGLPSILYAPGGKIERHSFSLWLKKLKASSKTFIRFNPYALRNTTSFNLIAQRRN